MSTLRSRRCKTCTEEFVLLEHEGYRWYCMPECTPSSPHFDPARDPNYRKGQSFGTQRGAALKFLYGMTHDDYNRMLHEQAGVCAVCWSPPAQGKMLAVDHCHETGEVRALLCGQCNVGIGMFGDSPDRLRDAAQYLEEHHTRLGREVNE